MTTTAAGFSDFHQVVNHFWAGVLEAKASAPLLGKIVENHADELEVLIVGLTPNHKGLIMVPSNGNPDDFFTIKRSDILKSSPDIMWGSVEKINLIQVDNLEIATEESHTELAAGVLDRINEEWDRQQKAEAARKENMRALAFTFETGLKVMLGESASFQVASKLNPDSPHFQAENLRITEPAIDRLIESLEQMKNHVKSFPYGQ